MVDVNNAKRVFKEYVSNYNLQDGKIALKVAHILRVSELSKIRFIRRRYKIS